MGKKARLGKKKCWVVKPIREIQDMLLQEQEFVYSSGDDFENHVVNCSSDEEERANPFWESDRKEAEGYLHAPDWFPTERRHEEFQEILERTEKPELFEDTVNKEDMYHMEHAARREARKKNILAQKKRLERMSASIKHEVPPRDIKREELGAEGGPKRTGDCVMVPTKKIKLCATPSRKGSLLKKEEFYKDVEVYAEDEEISVNRRVQALSVMQRSIKKLMRSVGRPVVIDDKAGGVEQKDDKEGGKAGEDGLKKKKGKEKSGDGLKKKKDKAGEDGLKKKKDDITIKEGSKKEEENWGRAKKKKKKKKKK